MLDRDTLTPGVSESRGTASHYHSDKAVAVAVKVKPLGLYTFRPIIL